jgi:hypothetical protein
LNTTVRITANNGEGNSSASNLDGSSIVVMEGSPNKALMV